MILSLDTEKDWEAIPVTRVSPSAAPEAQARGPALASLDEIIAMCRALGVGTGLFRGCQLM